jgi:hypothetical protein
MRYMWDRLDSGSPAVGRLMNSSSVLAKYKAHETAIAERIATQRAARLAHEAAGGEPIVSDSELVTKARIAQRRI